MSEFLAGLILGCLCGLLGMGFGNMHVFETHTVMVKEIDACEIHLPRDEGCHIIAVPNKDYPRIIR